jgi:hypothetical protein
MMHRRVKIEVLTGVDVIRRAEETIETYLNSEMELLQIFATPPDQHNPTWIGLALVFATDVHAVRLREANAKLKKLNAKNQKQDHGSNS